ncbi:MAG: hypothetical protein FWE85_02705 [Clostridiales bacterium]|nr:hypothetical protein [Clostridiales bacterium]
MGTERRENWFVSLTVLLNAAVFSASFYWLMSVLGRAEWVKPDLFRLTLFWAAMNGAVYLGNRLFLRKARSAAALVFVNTILYVAELAGLMFFLPEFRGFTQFNIIVWILLFGSTIFTVFSCLSPAGPLRIRLFFELSVIYLIIFLFVQAGSGAFAAYHELMLKDAGVYAAEFNVGGSPIIYSLPVFFTVLLNLACLLCLRVNAGRAGDAARARNAGAFLPLAVIIPACVVLAFVLLISAAPLGGRLAALLDGIVAAFAFIFGLAGKLLAWLTGFLPEEKPEPGPDPEPEPVPDPEPAPDPGAFPFGTVIFLLALAALAVYLLYRIRSLRLKAGYGGHGASTVRRSSPGFLEALRAWWREVRAGLSFFAASFSRRNTPQGVYLGLERLGARRKLTRNKGETHTFYLERLKEAAGRQNRGELAGLLVKLQGDLQERFYGKSPRALISQQELLWLRKNKKLIFAKEVIR